MHCCQILFSEAEEPQSPKPAKLLVASGGLTGFGVAQACNLNACVPVACPGLAKQAHPQDLLRIDFSPPEEAPEQFRAMTFNAHGVVEIRPGLSGMGCLTCHLKPHRCC